MSQRKEVMESLLKANSTNIEWHGFSCAWHGAFTELLASAGSHKTSAVTGRKGHALRAVGQQGKGSFQKWGV